MKQPIPNNPALTELNASLETMRPMMTSLMRDLDREKQLAAERDEELEREAILARDPVIAAVEGWRRALRLSLEVR